MPILLRDKINAFMCFMGEKNLNVGTGTLPRVRVQLLSVWPWVPENIFFSNVLCSY